jgi:hypothetical protein
MPIVGGWQVWQLRLPDRTSEVQKGRLGERTRSKQREKGLATEFLYRSSYFRMAEQPHRKLRRREHEPLPTSRWQFIERKNQKSVRESARADGTLSGTIISFQVERIFI